jgi:hypothetical protein
VFSLTHHFLIYYLWNYKILEFPDFRSLKQVPYEILGDDILIYHDVLAKEYILILDRLGVGYKRYIVSTSLFEFRKL